MVLNAARGCSATASSAVATQGHQSGAPNLDVRLTRSQSGSILDIDFVGGLSDGTVPAPISAAMVMMPVSYANSGAIISSGRKLKILEHRVHKVELRNKEHDEAEEELVVSNLRPFMLKVGVHDHLDQPVLDCTLPLRASLLYENGLPVKQTSSSEPLLVGETDVVALQGAATFKLRITSLSSHRDKQRFRIQVTPQEVELLQREPALCVVTDPMKSVTKLGRTGATAPAHVQSNASADSISGYSEASKRKHKEMLESHAQMMQKIADMQQRIVHEMHSVSVLARRVFVPNHVDDDTLQSAVRSSIKGTQEHAAAQSVESNR